MNKETAAKSIDLVISELKNSSFANRFSCTAEVNRKWNVKESLEQKVTRNLTCNVSPPLNKENKQEIEEIKKKINEAYKADKITHSILSEFSIQNSFKKGDKLPHYNDKLIDVYQSTPAQIKHKDGEVLLIDIWATWCGPCRDSLLHNSEMLEKYSAVWGDKVRIIAVSIEGNVEQIKERIKDKKWDKLIHFSQSEDNNPLLQDFEVKEIPFAVLINKQGIIDFVGDPTKTDIEPRIHELLAQSDSLESGESQYSNEIPKHDVKKLKYVIENELKSFIETSKEPKDFQIDIEISLQKEVTYTGVNKHVEYSAPSFKATIQKKQVSHYQILKKQLYSLLGESISFQKPSEKRSLKIDIKELAGIISRETQKQVEYEHLVKMKLILNSSFNLVKKREDHLLPVSKILIEPTDDDAKTSIATASEKCGEYIQQKFESGEYADHMLKQLYRGIQYTVKAEDIPAPVPRVNGAVYHKIKEVFDDESLLLKEKFETKLKYTPKLTIILKRHRVFDSHGNMKEKFYEQPILSYEVKDVDLESFKKNVIEKFLDRIGKDIILVVKEKTIKTESVPLGTNCRLCDADLDFPYFYNPFQREHYCLNCGNKRDENKKTIDSFNVPHNLVFIPSAEPEYLTGIESYKFGKDTHPKPEEEMKFKYKINCSFCECQIEVCRYICLNCKPGRLQKQNGYFDLCHECFDKSQTKKDEEFKKILKEENDGHHENHLLFKIITSEGGYRNF